MERLFGTGFIAQADALRSRNHILKHWATTGADAFLELNGLAEDIRVVEGKPGLDAVIRDLQEEHLSLPSWHLLHTAALFERGQPGTLLEFVTSDQDDAPDAVLNIHGKRVPLEAKFLEMSEYEKRFNEVSEAIVLALRERRVVPSGTGAYIILKSSVESDVSAVITEAVIGAVGNYRGTAVVARSKDCNVFLEPASSPGIIDYRIIYVLAPVPPDEDIRVLQRAKRASRQLRSLPSALDSGILSIGLSDNQDSVAVLEHIAHRIQRGRLRGIAGVLLIKRRTISQQQRSVIDLLEIRLNPEADSPLDAPLELATLGAAARLTEAEPHLYGIRSYSHGEATGKVAHGANASLSIPVLRVLTADMLE